MKLLSVNVGQPREVSYNGKSVSTGIFKAPVEGQVMVRKHNLDGDRQADLRVHGGVDKAVYAYPSEHYDYWKRELDRNDLTYGTFGENLTVEGLLEDGVHIGDVFRVGEAVVEVSQPRVPCFKLGIKIGNPGFLKPFLASGRVGFYFRVLEEGEVGADDAIERIRIGDGRMTVKTIIHLRYFDTSNSQAAQKAASLPALARGWRQAFRKLAANH